LFGHSRALPRFSPNFEKCYLDLPRPGFAFESRSLPIDAVYMLGKRQGDLTVPPIIGGSTAQAFIRLVANTYGIKKLDPTMRQHEFTLLARLVARVPLRQVLAPMNQVSPTQLCEAILEDHRLSSTHNTSGTYVTQIKNRHEVIASALASGMFR
jgi:hypothetical protein